MITIKKIFKKANKNLTETKEPEGGINLDKITSKKIKIIKEIKSKTSEDKIKTLNYKVWFNQFDMIATYLCEHPDQTLIDITNKTIPQINARSIISSWRAKKTTGKLPEYQEELINMLGFEEYCRQMEQKIKKPKTK